MASDRGLKYDTYLDERRTLVSTELEVSSRFDKSVLTLAGGALLLSMTYVKDIADHPDSVSMLFTAWVLLAIAIGMMLVSLLTSQSAFRRQRAILDAQLDNPKACGKLRNRYASATNWLNVSSIAMFLMALIFMAMFVQANLPGK